jgi:hypothetical protein
MLTAAYVVPTDTRREPHRAFSEEPMDQAVALVERLDEERIRLRWHRHQRTSLGQDRPERLCLEAVHQLVDPLARERPCSWNRPWDESVRIG